MHKSVKNGHRKQKTSYDRIKTIIGGFFMPRSYINISMYESEISLILVIYIKKQIRALRLSAKSSDYVALVR